MKMLRFVYNKILPSLFWIMLLLAFDSPYMAIQTLLAAALHEAGHIFTSVMLLKTKASMPKAVFYGLRIDTGGIISYKQEFWIAFGGPLANLIIFLLSLPFFRTSGYLEAFGLINLFTALSNLLPLRSYDGERMLHSVASRVLSPYAVNAFTHVICLLLSSFGCFLSLFLVGRVGEGYWIFAVFFVSFLNEIFIHSKKHFNRKKRE